MMARPSGRPSKEDVREAAKAECHRRGWPWVEPVHVQRRLRSWHVLTNAHYIGGNVSISVDAKTGEVSTAVFYPR